MNWTRPLSLATGSHVPHVPRLRPSTWFSYNQQTLEDDEEVHGDNSSDHDGNGDIYMSPMTPAMSPMTQVSQLTCSPLEERVTSPCSDLDLDYGETNHF